MSNKVVICGVNTATLPHLSDQKATELLTKIALGDEITVQNVDEQKEVFFKFTVSSRGRYAFTTDVTGLTALIYNSSYADVTNNTLYANTTYYLKLNYITMGNAQDFKFILSKQ